MNDTNVNKLLVWSWYFSITISMYTAGNCGIELAMS